MRQLARTLFLVAVGFLAAWALGWAPVLAQTPAGAASPSEEAVKGVVRAIFEERTHRINEYTQAEQVLSVELLSGARAGTMVTVDYVVFETSGRTPASVGDHLWLSATLGADGEPMYLVMTVDRSGSLLWLSLAFALLVVLTGQGQGLRSLVGLVLSCAVIFAYVVPRLSSGASPVGVAVLGAMLAMPLTYYLCHGLNRKTTVALVASLVGLFFTAILAENVIIGVGLTGYASDAAGFLQTGGVPQFSMESLLMAGMVVAVLGVLDDVTVAQAAVVEQLAEANPVWSWRRLFVSGMKVGQDHIASMVNTLVLVYAGGSLPLLLLLSDRSLPVAYVISQEIVAEEIARTLVTSMGVVAVVPLTTLFAAYAMRRWPRRPRIKGDHPDRQENPSLPQGQ